MRTLTLTTAFLLSLAALGTAAADVVVCAGSNCAGYTLDTGKQAVCTGGGSLSGTYVIVCTGDDPCPTYYDVNGFPKGCTTDAGLGNLVYAAVSTVDGLLP